jgi:hypothetical protein
MNLERGIRIAIMSPAVNSEAKNNRFTKTRLPLDYYHILKCVHATKIINERKMESLI